MNRTRSLAPLILLLAVGAATVASQPVVEQEVEDEAVVATDAAADAQPAQGEDDAKPAVADDSPFDYQASEKISEDLSVSFPVDI